jgi:hypothetical protein
MRLAIVTCPPRPPVSYSLSGVALAESSTVQEVALPSSNILTVYPIFEMFRGFTLFYYFFLPHEEVGHLQSFWPSYMSFLYSFPSRLSVRFRGEATSILSALHLFCKNRLDCRPVLRSTLVISVEPLFIM